MGRQKERVVRRVCVVGSLASEVMLGISHSWETTSWLDGIEEVNVADIGERGNMSDSCSMFALIIELV